VLVCPSEIVGNVIEPVAVVVPLIWTLVPVKVGLETVPVTVPVELTVASVPVKVGCETVPPGVYVASPEEAALTVAVLLVVLRLIDPAGVYVPEAVTAPFEKVG